VPNYYCQGPGDLVDGRGAPHIDAGGQGRGTCDGHHLDPLALSVLGAALDVGTR